VKAKPFATPQESRGASPAATQKRENPQIPKSLFPTPDPRSPTMNLLTQPVGVAHYLMVGAVLFVCGVVCMAT
jgi:hypothetical protein